MEKQEHILEQQPPPTNNAATIQPPDSVPMHDMQAPTMQPLVPQTIILNPPLGHDPTQMICPHCRNQIVTLVSYEVGIQTHIIAAILCLLTGLLCAWIPYVYQKCQVGNHYCPSCSSFLGSHKSISL